MEKTTGVSSLPFSDRYLRKMSFGTHTMVSLFSGAGGMDLGFVLTGKFQPLVANDILSAPALTYACNFQHQIIDISKAASLDGECPIYLLGDISDVDFDITRQRDIDLVIGGPPCQDFSVVRGPEKERQGIDVKRGRLYAHFIRALIHMQPKVFVFENVPGLKSANKGTAYKTILADFSELNLKWEEIRKIVGNSSGDSIHNYTVIFSKVVDSANLGVPQRRKRLIIIGVREDLLDWNSECELRQEAENTLSGRNHLFRKYPLTPLEVFQGRPLSELGAEYRCIMEAYVNVADEVMTERALAWKHSVWQKLDLDAVSDYLKVNNITPTNSGEVDKAFEEHAWLLRKMGYYKSKLDEKGFGDMSNNVPNELWSVLERQRMIPPDQNCLFVAGTKWEVEGRGMSLIYRRVHPLKPSYTVVAYGGGGTWGYHYERNRSKLTHRERARLQTFPDTFMFKGNASEVRAQIGEAVPPLLAENIARIVTAILSMSKNRHLAKA